ncbi:hypothetical protein M9H77_35232 [Catharanthus roseus]|uniref:Uncharacterized protein n=1 Tax=Catharanthus roseus TaxID=4058 RepID=A0ACB9ZQK7_CATRO|nr:hypothetical protein M9H77_35232 [Catharanthus roseus]
MATSENWQLFVHNGRHNYKIAVHSHGHAQSVRLTEEQLQQTEQFRKSHVPPRNILRFFREQEVGCAISSQKIYNVVAKIKRDRMQGRNTVDEVLRLKCVGMTPTGKNFTVATAFIHIDQNVLAKLTEMVKDEEVAQRFVNGSWRKLINKLDEVEFQRKVWTSQVMHFGVATMNRAESEHSILKLWLSTRHGDLDTVFFNIDSLIQAQVSEIKYSLEISRLKEKYGAESNPILKNLCNKISHLGLKKIMDELKKTR